MKTLFLSEVDQKIPVPYPISQEQAYNILQDRIEKLNGIFLTEKVTNTQYLVKEDLWPSVVLAQMTDNPKERRQRLVLLAEKIAIY